MSLNIIGGPISPIIEYFEVIKEPPSILPEVDYINDTDFPINNLHKKFFQFRYRFVYDDNEKSVWSAISKMPIPENSIDDGSNTQGGFQNSITIVVKTGDLNVAKIEIAGRLNIESEWSDFFLIDTLDKKRDKIQDNTSYTYIFRNDSVYTPIDLQESNLLFDYVPDKANALELANGNTLVVGGLKDGYNRDVELDVTLTSINMKSPAVLSTLTATLSGPLGTGTFPNYASYNDNYSGSIDEIYAGTIIFSGVPQVGDEITIDLQGYSTRPVIDDFGGIDSYKDYKFNDMVLKVVVKEGWGINDIIREFQVHPSRFGYGFWTEVGVAGPRQPFYPIDSDAINPIPGGANPNTLYLGAFLFKINGVRREADSRRWHFYRPTVTVRRAFSFNGSDSFPTLKWNGLYRYGLAYYNNNGKTNGVFTNNSMVLRTTSYDTSYEWTPGTLASILPENQSAQMYIGHTPPEWADYYHVVRTKDLSCDFSLMVISPDINFNTPLNGYWYIDIHSITETNADISESKNVINYNSTTFVDGDRVRIFQKLNNDGTVAWSNDKHIDLPIIAVETHSSRQYLKVKSIQIPTGYISLSGNERLVIEIYRPAKVLSDENLVYYEIGERYDISTGPDGIRRHNGQETVSGIIISQYNLTGTVKFYALTKTIEIISPQKSFSLLPGDKISFSNSISNNSTFTVASFRFDVVNRFWTAYITVVETVVNETNTSGNILLSKLSVNGKEYTYINLANDGDYYYRARVMVATLTGRVQGTLYVADKNFSDNYISAVWSQGRPLIVDEDIKEEYYPAMLRFSQSYIYGTNINNLNRFYPNNFEEADASFGDILRLKTRENFIRLFQRFKTGMIPIYRQIIIDNAQSSQVALSERLLNKPNYYSGEYGIDKYGSSLVSTDFGDYFIDTNNKAIVRVSLDGITNISDTYNIATWANANISEDSYGYGCFNYENRNVIMLIGTFKESLVFPGVFLPQINIVAYSESDKKFESFYGFVAAENMQFVNGFIFSGANGQWYIHDNPVRNNFFGSQQSSAITTVFNGGLQLKKTYTAIEELANGLWTGTITTGPLTNQLSSLVEGDFAKTIGAYTINSKENKFNATIKRDQNSAGGKFQGDTMKGLYAQVALTNSLTTEQRLISVSLKYIPSPLTNS
jgi:hypothetical protein